MLYVGRGLSFFSSIKMDPKEKAGGAILFLIFSFYIFFGLFLKSENLLGGEPAEEGATLPDGHDPEHG